MTLYSIFNLLYMLQHLGEGWGGRKFLNIVLNINLRNSKNKSTWSPRFKPASVALLPKSTLSTKIPNPFSDPPSKIKGKGASRDGFVNVINLRLALAAHAIFNSLRCPPIFCKGKKVA